MSYTLGQDVEAFCKKCEIVLSHTIIKLTGNRISRVACGTCKDEHAYVKRHPKPSGAVSDAQKASTARRQATKAASAFAAVMDHVDTSRAAPYTSASVFEQDDVIEHHAFGLGRVTRILAGNKIEVIFEQSSKILMHGVASLSR